MCVFVCIYVWHACQRFFVDLPVCVPACVWAFPYSFTHVCMFLYFVPTKRCPQLCHVATKRITTLPVGPHVILRGLGPLHVEHLNTLPTKPHNPPIPGQHNLPPCIKHRWPHLWSVAKLVALTCAKMPATMIPHTPSGFGTIGFWAYAQGTWNRERVETHDNPPVPIAIHWICYILR